MAAEDVAPDDVDRPWSVELAAIQRKSTPLLLWFHVQFACNYFDQWAAKNKCDNCSASFRSHATCWNIGAIIAQKHNVGKPALIAQKLPRVACNKLHMKARLEIVK